MRFQLWFVTGMAILFMLVGLYISMTGYEKPLSGKYFFIVGGILFWFIGNQLVQLNRRVDELEQRLESAPPDSKGTS